MKIKLPQHRTQQESPTVNNNLVIVGANGSGKTRFASNIEDNYAEVAVRITQSTYSEKFKGLIRSISSKEQKKDENSNFSSMKNIWDTISSNRLLDYRHNSILLVDKFDKNHTYPINEMGETEGLLLFVIASVINAPKGALLIIDEPEMHTKKSAIIKLWNLLEWKRKDCQFVFLTHDVPFASSRHDFKTIWLKDFNGENWDYEILVDENHLPDQLYLELLSERKPTLFIEGDSINSIDYKLLQPVFPDYLLKPLGGCEKVLATTKSLNEQKVFHDLDAFGLVDRDRRSFSEIQRLTKSHIWVTKVAEIENFLMLENIIKEIAISRNKNPDQVFHKVKNNVINFFREEMKTQALEHAMAKIDRIFSTVTGNSKGKTFDDVQQNLEEFWETKDFVGIYKHYIRHFQELIDKQNYQGVLQVFNNKSLINRSEICSICDLKCGNKNLLNSIIRILNLENKSSEIIIKSIRKNILTD